MNKIYKDFKNGVDRLGQVPMFFSSDFKFFIVKLTKRSLGFSRRQFWKVCIGKSLVETSSIKLPKC